MKKIISLLFVIISLSNNLLACGYYDPWDGMLFYNLFDQTNISAEEYYPFLRADYTFFYESTEISNEKKSYPKGNIRLWHELLTTWSITDIEQAVYNFPTFNWSKKNSLIENSVQTYLAFAQKCTETFSYRKNLYSWNYSDLLSQRNFDTASLLSEANLFINKEANIQLQSRYYYQLIRILHYSKMWNEAIKVFENSIEGKICKNEIYYYILDQVAGCYYSTGNYEKAAYMFTKVFNHSYDRKKSAFISYNFCAQNGFEGRQYFNGIDDEKDLLLIKSLYDFSDRISTIHEFINLDADDSRVELLFMRLLNNTEREIWPKNIGVSDKTLPNIDENLTEDIEKLTLIAIGQANNLAVMNKDFWILATSYLYFINQNLNQAKQQLKKVKSFEVQKQILSDIYLIFSWDRMDQKNEETLMSLLKKNEFNNLAVSTILVSQPDWIMMCLDKVAHLYYAQNELAKAFLIHNKLEVTDYLTSFQLLTSMEELYNKCDKSDFEKTLISNMNDCPYSFIDYVYNQQAIYYLYHNDPISAMVCFNKMKTEIDRVEISAQIFSNNTKEGFTFPVDSIMVDEVYKASIFSFIKPYFSRKELAENLVRLVKMRYDRLPWKRKLANYLLGNFYFNISNTGYYRGALNGRSNVGYNNYFNNDFYEDDNPKYDAEIINSRVGYNLSNIEMHRNKYNRTCDFARSYFENVIHESTDVELNARCWFMLAKCELNSYYNKANQDSYSKCLSQFGKALLESESFKQLEERYADTKFHEMIVKECSYFRYYTLNN